MDELEALRRENREQRALIARLIGEIARLADRVTELLAVAQPAELFSGEAKLPSPLRAESYFAL